MSEIINGFEVGFKVSPNSLNGPEEVRKFMVEALAKHESSGSFKNRMRIYWGETDSPSTVVSKLNELIDNNPNLDSHLTVRESCISNGDHGFTIISFYLTLIDESNSAFKQKTSHQIAFYKQGKPGLLFKGKIRRIASSIRAQYRSIKY